MAKFYIFLFWKSSNFIDQKFWIYPAHRSTSSSHQQVIVEILLRNSILKIFVVENALSTIVVATSENNTRTTSQ
jgi:hypothetical protein